MYNTGVISELIKWIENNLEKPLSIDIVAKKSGYSKWHLQRAFKHITGQTIAAYIRYRRLTYSALSLRFTDKSITDIVIQYQFDSAQTFTRLFKTRFQMTPARYRKEKYLVTKGLVPEYSLSQPVFTLPEPRFISVPETLFYGITYKVDKPLSALLKEKVLLREQIFNDYLTKLKAAGHDVPTKIYAVIDIHNGQNKRDETEILYTIAVDSDLKIDHVEKYIMEPGLYLCYHFKGSSEDFDLFILQIYLSALPALDVKRRPGRDIEIHYNINFTSQTHLTDNSTDIDCDFCVPVIRLDEFNQSVP